MERELFVDGFGNIIVTGTMVRIDLVSLVEPGAEGAPPRFEHRQRVVMPLDGFLRSFGMAEGVVKKMVDAGVVAKRNPGDAGEIVVQEPAKGSPNFN